MRTGQILGGGEVRQGKRMAILNPKSQLWKNLTTHKVIMKGQPSNFTVRDHAKGSDGQGKEGKPNALMT